MSQRKRKAQDSLDEVSPVKRAKTNASGEVKLTVDLSGTTEKVYNTVTFVSSAHLKMENQNGDKALPESEIENPRSRPKRSKPKKSKIDPLRELGDGTRVNFDTGIVLQRDGDHYTCTCPAFRDKIVNTTTTTCDHLQEYLGDEFETWRVSKSGGVIRQHVTVNVLLAHKFEEDSNDPTGWWLSEKLDGVRALWNGKCFYSRLGNAFYAPSWFTKDLPRDMCLDGELFGGRGQFQDTVRVVKSGPDADWSTIRFHIFDCPSMEDEPFEKRMNATIEMFKRKRPIFAVFVEHTKCKGLKHLNETCDRILLYGGEGVMLRMPKSAYERFRSKTLLKMKKFYDAEAVVIGHEESKSGTWKCGALRCRMECGKEFSVGSGLTMKDRNKPPKIGSIITYKFQELTKSGVPRFPSYLGLRIDMTSPKDATIRTVISE